MLSFQVLVVSFRRATTLKNLFVQKICFQYNLQNSAFQAPEEGYDNHKKVFTKCADLMRAIHNAPVPIIAKVDGLAAAGGCQLVASCDIVVCTDRSSFSTPG